MSPPSRKPRVAGVDAARASLRTCQKADFVHAKEALLARLRETPLAAVDVPGQHASPYHGDASPYFHWVDEQSGYPETLRRLRAYPMGKLEAEKWDLRYATSDPCCGLNAVRWLFLVDTVIAERAALLKKTRQRKNKRASGQALFQFS